MKILPMISTLMFMYGCVGEMIPVSRPRTKTVEEDLEMTCKPLKGAANFTLRCENAEVVCYKTTEPTTLNCVPRK